MTPTQRKRLTIVLCIVIGVGLATTLVLLGIQKGGSYFVTPTEVKQQTLPDNKLLRIGGIVVDDSVSRDGVDVRFDLTDGANSVTVLYSGILPDLFREGQGIIATGNLNQQGEFHADEVLAKHDENYMPAEIAEAIKSGKITGEQYKHGD